MIPNDTRSPGIFLRFPFLGNDISSLLSPETILHPSRMLLSIPCLVNDSQLSVLQELCSIGLLSIPHSLGMSLNSLWLGKDPQFQMFALEVPKLPA